jgi:hypothetical protein
MMSLALAWRLLLLVITAGVAVNILTLPPPEAIDPKLVAPQPAAAPAAEPPKPTEPDATYPAITEFPLFTESRKRWAPPPPPPAPPPAPPAPSPLTSYTVAGVIVSADVRSALVRRANETKTILLTEGEQLEGWTLKEITRDRLQFVAGPAVYEMIPPGAPDPSR